MNALLYDDDPLTRYGFTAYDADYSVHVFGGSFDTVLEALEDNLPIRKRASDIYGETIDLSEKKIGILYKLKIQDYIIFDSLLCSSPDIKLRNISRSLPNLMVAIFFNGEETGYSIYRDGLLEKCFIPAFTKVRGYEDLNAKETDDVFSKEEKTLGSSHYYHIIDRTKDIDTLVITENIEKGTPDPYNGNKVRELGIYIPYLLLETTDKTSSQYLFDVPSLGNDAFDRLDCLWFD